MWLCVFQWMSGSSKGWEFAFKKNQLALQSQLSLSSQKQGSTCHLLNSKTLQVLSIQQTWANKVWELDVTCESDSNLSLYHQEEMARGKILLQTNLMTSTILVPNPHPTTVQHMLGANRAVLLKQTMEDTLMNVETSPLESGNECTFNIRKSISSKWYCDHC